MGTGEADGENRAMAATELALNNPLIDEYTLQGAKGLLVNITGGSDIKLFEVDAAVNKIRAEVDPEAELIFGAIKDENMNGKIRVSIVATALHGSGSKPYLNLVNTTNNSSLNRGPSQGDTLFNAKSIDNNITSSIDGATALKLDESLEIKNSDEQNALIDSFESKEEIKIAQEEVTEKSKFNNEIPSGVSIESASYMENNPEMKLENTNKINGDYFKENTHEENTPKLFAEDHSQENLEIKDDKADADSTELFDQDTNEDEDFEIPAFLRRQKF